MLAEFVELWNWMYGMVAGWSTITVFLIVSITVLYVKHFRLKRQVESLYHRLVADERDFNLRK